MPMSGSLYMLPYIYIYAHSKDTPLQSIYVVLKNAPLCIQVSGSLKLLLNIYTYIRLSKDTHIYMAIYVSLDMPKMLFYVCQY
jgi:hypothetical protein